MALSTVPDSTTGEIHENSLRCIPTQYAQGIIFDILLAFTLNRTVLAAISAYQQRSGIECMFKDCKSGGYNLEGCHAIESRLYTIVLLIEDCLYKRNYSRYRY
jgi:hypothetical protein